MRSSESRCRGWPWRPGPALRARWRYGALLPHAWAATAPAAAPSAAAPAAVAGFSYVKSLGGIDEYRLDSNGLTVLLVPDHSAPVVTFQVTYQVGSRNEVTGTTGATHILEHMMFKGSEAFNDPKGNSIKQYLERVGGQFNASTSFDRTNYFATIGRDSLEGYIAIEADRMRHLWLHEADRQSEMTVVRNEYERGKNDPDNVLMEEVTEAAYVALPYHHPIIGWKSDIEHVPIAKLRDFYDTFYWPNNATVTVVGDIDTVGHLGTDQEILRRVSALAGAHSRDLHRGAGAERRTARHRQAAGRTRHRDHRPQGAERPGCRSAGARHARCDFEFGQERASVPGAGRSGLGLERRRRHRFASRPVAAHRVRGARARGHSRAGREGAAGGDRQDQNRRRDRR